LDATYRFTPDGPATILANASYVHERESFVATFDAAGSNDDPNNHLNALRLDASYAYRQTWSAGVGVFDITGTRDLTLLTPSPLTGSNSGSPNSRGYILQFEYVPFGKS
jgi:hypothetical protein